MAAWGEGEQSTEQAPQLLPRRIDESLSDARKRAGAMTLQEAQAEMAANPLLTDAERRSNVPMQILVAGAAVLAAVGLARPIGAGAQRFAELMFPPQQTETHIVRTQDSGLPEGAFGYREITKTTTNIP